MNPKYPIYIISKGRWESRLTSKALENMRVPYHIVIEPQEYEEYAAVINPDKIYTLPFSNLGQGSIPARNWVWEHSIQAGAERHWIIDDNIEGIYRYNHNMQVKVTSGTAFRCMEDFADRYENIALCGPQYFMFVKRRVGPKQPALLFNTRVYSCTLIKNGLQHRWRGKYNEDTDLSIRVLKDKWCTVLFYAFNQMKAQTMTMKGGNTDTVYIDGDNRKKFAESLRNQHPDVVKITKKFGRWHHQVDYISFKRNQLIKKGGLVVPDRVNNYGMVLKQLSKKD